MGMTERAIIILVDTIHAGWVDGTRKSADVEIYEVCAGLNEADLRGFEIRTSTGYRAVFPWAHTECTRIVCTKHNAFTAPTRESGTHCHGLHHIEQIRAFAGEVAKTYGSDRKIKSVARPINAFGMRQMSARNWAETEWAQTMEALIE